MKNDKIIRLLKNTPAITHLASQSSPPEWANHQTATALFGLGRSTLYILADEGHIKTVSVQRAENTRGKRLFDCASIRAFLNSASVTA
jgi:hypothetical protein